MQGNNLPMAKQTSSAMIPAEPATGGPAHRERAVRVATSPAGRSREQCVGSRSRRRLNADSPRPLPPHESAGPSRPDAQTLLQAGGALRRRLLVDQRTGAQRAPTHPRDAAGPSPRAALSRAIRARGGAQALCMKLRASISIHFSNLRRRSGLARQGLCIGLTGHRAPRYTRSAPVALQQPNAAMWVASSSPTTMITNP